MSKYIVLHIDLTDLTRSVGFITKWSECEERSLSTCHVSQHTDITYSSPPQLRVDNYTQEGSSVSYCSSGRVRSEQFNIFFSLQNSKPNISKMMFFKTF